MKRVGLLILCFIFISPVFVKALEKTTTDLAPNAKSAILIEASTGEIIYEKNSHEKLAPASMTKMMSMLIVVESIEAGIIDWDQKITVSENASSMGGSQILLETGEQMTVSDLFKGVAVMSGNDAVVALAEAVAGNVEEFVKMMNDKVKELGLKDTVFKNPHGLDTANHYSSAYDMAMIAKELVRHEKILEYTSIYEDYLRKGTDREIWLTNTNKLTRFYPGVDGLKTGYTSEAGYCLTATAKKSSMRLISVAMGEPDSKTRNSEITSMLDYGFAQYKIIELIRSNKVVAKMEVDKAKNKYVKLIPSETVTVLTKKADKLGKISYNLKTKSAKAPIKKGTNLGTLQILEDGKVINEVKVTTNTNIKKANIAELYLRYLNDIINGQISL